MFGAVDLLSFPRPEPLRSVFPDPLAGLSLPLATALPAVGHWASLHVLAPLKLPAGIRLGLWPPLDCLLCPRPGKKLHKGGRVASSEELCMDPQSQPLQSVGLAWKRRAYFLYVEREKAIC